jgi:glycosyltransferase involved in cell wall biosynthesis
MAHCLPPEESTGTTLVALGYASELGKRGWDVAVVYASAGARGWDGVSELRRDHEPFVRYEVPRPEGLGATWSLDASSVPLDPSSEPDAAFVRLLDTLAPDLVHVVDNVHMPLSWPEIARARGVPVVRTVSSAEDICVLVAPVSPLSGRRGYCEPPLSPERCAACFEAAVGPEWKNWSKEGGGTGTLPAGTSDVRGSRGDGRSAVATRAALSWWRSGVTEKILAKRARAARQFESVFDRVIFASEGYRRYFEKTLPLDPAIVRIVPMGVDLDAAPSAGSAGMPPAGSGTSSPGGLDAAPSGGSAGAPGPRPVHFLAAASIDRVKGFGSIVEAFTSPALLSRNDYVLHIAGGGERSPVRPLLDRNPRVVDEGAFSAADLPVLLARCDVGLSTSFFETFHRVTREYLRAGLPVIGSRAFGITDAIEHGRNGLLFDHAEPASLERAVCRLLDDRDLLERLSRGASESLVRSVSGEVDDLESIYRELLDR